MLHDFVDMVDSTVWMKRKMAKAPQLDKVVFTLSVKVRQASTPISGPIQAQKLPSDLGVDNPSDFNASKR